MDIFTTQLPTLDIIIGPMFSGKTTELVRRLTIYDKLKLRVLYINSADDDRTNEDFSTHNQTLKTLGNIISTKVHGNDLETFDVSGFDVIGIDEAQFFPTLDRFVQRVVEVQKKKVILAGLNGDFKRRSFGKIIDLIPFCDNITKLFPFCVSCLETKKSFQPALFSKRQIKAKSDDLVLIGGDESYIPVCRECYLQNL